MRNIFLTILVFMGSLMLNAQCEIGNVTVTQLPCTNTGTFGVEINFNYSNTTPNGFTVTGGGWNHGSFLYTQLPITINNLPGNGQDWEFVITDVAPFSCTNYALLGPVTCSSTNCSVESIINSDWIEPIINGAIAEECYCSVGIYEYDNTLVVFAPGMIGELTCIDFSYMVWNCDGEVIYQSGSFPPLFDINDFLANSILVETLVSCSTNNECSIYDLIAEAYCEASTPAIDYQFAHTNTGNVGFDFYVNNIFHSFHSYGQTFYTQTFPDIEAGPISITVSDNDNPNCSDTYTISLPDCTAQPNCSIYDVTATATECENGQFYVLINFLHTNTSGSYNLNTSLGNFGPFGNEDLPYLAGPFGPMAGTVLQFLVQDAQQTTCSASGYIIPPTCSNNGECSISNLTATASCDGNAAYIHYSFGYANTGNAYYELFANDILLTTIPFTQMGEWIMIPEQFEGQMINFTVAVNDNTACHQSMQVAIPHCPASTNDCSIYDVTATATACENGQFYVTVHWFHDNTSGTVIIHGGGMTYGYFPAGEGSATLGPFTPNSLDVMEFVVSDAQIDGCSDYAVIEAPNCSSNDCHIYDLWAEADCDNSTGIVTLHYGFQYANVMGTAFTILVNNTQVGTHGYEGQDFVYSLEVPQNLEGTTIILRINTSMSSICFDAVEVNIPVCNINNNSDCWIEALQAQASPCSENLFYVTIDFNYGQNSNEGFVIHGGPNNFTTQYGTFSYSDLPVSIGPFEANGQAMVFGVSDLVTDGCDSPLVTVLAPTCNNSNTCSISGLTANVICDGTQSYINFSFNHANTNPAGFDVMINNDFVSFMPYTAAGIGYHLLIPENLQGTTIIFSVSDNDNPICHAAIEVVVPDCTSSSLCTLTELSAMVGPCIDGHFFVTLDFNAANGSESFIVQGNGMNYGTYSYGDLPIQLGPFTGTGSGQMEFVVHDAAINSCDAEVVIAVPQCNNISPCVISGLQAEINCDGPSAYLHFHFIASGVIGNSFSASINGANLGNFVYGLTNYTINLGNQYAGQTIQFTVNDSATDNCSQTVSLLVPNCTGEPVCDIYNLTATASDCENGQFYTTIQFNHNNSGDLFHLTSGNGIDYGIYSYADLPVVLGPFEGNGTTVYGFEVSDIAHPGCGGFVILGTVNCGEPPSCVIYNLTASSLCVEGEVELSFSFNYNGSVGNFFNVYVNNSFISELPFGQTSYTISVPESGWQNAILTVATQVAGYSCSDEVQVFIPNCSEINDCSIFDLTATPLPCNSDGNYYVELNFEYINTGAQFSITNGENLTYGNFYYPALPIIIGPFDGDGSTAHIFEVNDLTEAGCSDSVTLSAVGCQAPICEIGEITYTLSDCSTDGNFNATINFDHANTGNTGFNLYVEGDLYGSYPFSALPVSIQGLSGNGLTIYDIVVEALSWDNCNSIIQIVAPDCDLNECIITNLDVQIVDCNDGIITATVDFDAAYVGLNGFTLSSNVNIGGVYSYSSLPLTLSWPETFGGFVEIQITNNGNSDCTAMTVLEGLSCGTQVWPGDANSDGIANNFDLLALGLTYGYEGAQRVGASLVWEGQWCLDWDGQFMNGVNHKHTDCDGNGFVSDADMAAINLNYGQVHGKGTSEADEFEAPLYVDIPSGSIPSGTLFEAPIVFGSSEIFAENVYGMAFTITYDPTIFADNTQSISFENGWLGHYNSQVKTLVKHFPENHQFEIAITRIGHTNIATGYGEVGMLRAILVENIEGKTNYDFQFVISDVRIISHDESDVPYSLPLDTGTVQSSGIGGINEGYDVGIYPNPAQNHIILSGLDGATAAVNIYNTAGSLVYNRQTLSEGEVINLPNLAAGLYFTEVITPIGPVRTKLYISRR